MSEKQSPRAVYASRVERAVAVSADALRSAGIAPEAWRRIALNALVMSPEVADCTPQSVDQALLRCIEAELVPDGIHAALTTFRNRKRGVLEAQLMVMAEGRVLLARRAVPGIVIRSQVVYRDDKWSYREGLTATIEHEPAQDGDRSDGAIIAAYATMQHPRSNSVEWVWLWRAQIERYRAMGKSPAWDTDYAAMCRKTAILRLRLPRKSTDPPDWREEASGPADVGVAAAEPRIVGPALPPPADDDPPPEQAAAVPAEPAPAAEENLDDSPF